jgi:hypothetical protein
MRRLGELTLVSDGILLLFNANLALLLIKLVFE